MTSHHPNSCYLHIKVNRYEIEYFIGFNFRLKGLVRVALAIHSTLRRYGSFIAKPKRLLFPNVCHLLDEKEEPISEKHHHLVFVLFIIIFVYNFMTMHREIKKDLSMHE